ncbi:MAG: hypothetical protein ACREQ9_05310, partial [Candidatus Binatia bacterium]
AKIEERKDASSQANAGSAGGKQGVKQAPDKTAEQGEGGNQKAAGAGTAGESGDRGEAKGSAGNSLRGQAASELSKIAGELRGGEQQTAKAEAAKQGQEKPKPSDGGIKGPESGGDKTEQEGSGSKQSRADPNKPGNEPKSAGDAQGEAKQPHEAGTEPAEQGKGGRGQGGEGSSAGMKPLPSADGKPAERYYKPGEGTGGSEIQDGRYVRIRVPEENGAALGAEIVAKPGDVDPETPYGNAPLPSAGAPGDIAVDQPRPLEYRDALAAGTK